MKLFSIFLVLQVLLAGKHRALGDVSTCPMEPTEACSDEPFTRSRVLGYVTPWNARGYDVAKQHREKFTHISPVWYQLKLENGAPLLTGGHDLDADWMRDLRTPVDEGDSVPFTGPCNSMNESIQYIMSVWRIVQGDSRPRIVPEEESVPRIVPRGDSVPRIVPRVVVEILPHQHAELLTILRSEVVEALVQECKRSKSDGMVLDVWSTWDALGLVQAKFGDIKTFTQSLSKVLHKQDGHGGTPMELILVIPPPVPAKQGSKPPISQKHFQQLEKFVDGFSLMTYDYNVHNAPGPNAPLHWVKKNLELLKPSRGNEGKVLMGLNFYGRDFSTEDIKDILGHDYTAALARERAMKHWDDRYQEETLTFKDGKVMHVVFYPTVKSFQMRMDLAKEYGAGISIWELGQGLDEFMTVLQEDASVPEEDEADYIVDLDEL